ncbi:MAG: assimilatory sulfite reductase (NADPH) flavoprotein subunit [Oleiphilaceae bacterium]|nr:assimilatory sulfite reductase (NADPH) flavoprotein subunit [Oleiphilaceae bacterium]
MAVSSDQTPLTQEQARQLEELLQGLDERQRDWLAGYLHGLQSAGRSPGSADAGAQTRQGPVLTVLYGSQTGNAESLAEQLGEQAKARGLPVTVQDMADYKPRQLKKEAFVALLASTHGEGDPPDNALDFHEFLHGRKAPDLKGVHYAVLSLGDSSYEHFCQTGKDLDARMSALGASPLVDRVDCDIDYDEPAEAWMESLLEACVARSGASAPASSPGQAPAASDKPRYNRKNPFMAPVLEHLVLTGEGSGKDTRHLEFSLEDSGLSYQPGDALGVYPSNDPALVAALLEALEMDGDTPVSVGKKETSLREALQHYREITQLTRPLMEAWARQLKDESLNQLVADHKALNDWMRGRDLLDLVRQWPIKDLSPQTLTGMLRSLAPRLYSIASSQAAVEDEVHITVAPVRYQAHDRAREGVASTWLAQRLEEDTRVPVYIDPNKNFKLPENDDTPLIMIGPGTGVAPFRAFMQEREERGASGRNWLFFGEQHFRSDFLYQSEWLAWRRSGLLERISVAFSRDQPEKRYVQHRLRECAEALWRWIEEGAWIYVCGDADAMAPDVNEALIDIIAQQGRRSREQAQDFLRQLAREKRYQRDIY